MSEKKGVGRPKMMEHRTRMTLYLDQAMLDEIRKMAGGTPATEYVREAVRRRLEQEG